MKYGYRTRLQRRLEQRTKRQTLFFLLGIFSILFLLGIFFVPFVQTVGKFFSLFKNEKTSSSVVRTGKSLLIPPVLSPIPTATNSASISISGITVQKDVVVQLFINDSKESEIPTQEDGTFEFENVGLQEGRNVIKARVKRGTEFSKFSDEYQIIYKASKPLLEIVSPSDGATYSKDDNQITLKGKTDPENSVTVNGFLAVVDQEGSFSYPLSLQNGENRILVVAKDQAGNATEKEIKVFYNP